MFVLLRPYKEIWWCVFSDIVFVWDHIRQCGELVFRYLACLRSYKAMLWILCFQMVVYIIQGNAVKYYFTCLTFRDHLRQCCEIFIIISTFRDNPRQSCELPSQFLCFVESTWGNAVILFFRCLIFWDNLSQYGDIFSDVWLCEII